MKKIILLIICLLFISGCSNIQSSSYEKIINDVLKSNKKIYNEYRNGYKYYLPRGLNISGSNVYNEKFSTNHNEYYLFVDFVGYKNKTTSTYEINDNSYYSYEIKYKDNFGYLEINETKDKFYIEMMYNYAKIEIVTDKEYLNEEIYNSIVILSSIKYNDIVIDKLMSDEELNYKEMPYNIFTPKESSSNIIDIIDDYDIYPSWKDEIPDSDLVK